MKPGGATIISITASAVSGYKLIATEVECVDFEPLKIACPQIIFKFKNHNLADGVEHYCKAGGAHHMAVAPGIISEELKLLAEMLHIDFEKV
jgi:L-arabinose isomerase